MLEKRGCIRNSGKLFFSHRTVGLGRWNSLDQETVDAPSVDAFKGKLHYTYKGGFFHGLLC